MICERILSSTSYRSSKRKHKILCAMEDPRNSELVKQLNSYLIDVKVDNSSKDSDDAAKLNTKSDEGITSKNTSNKSNNDNSKRSNHRSSGHHISSKDTSLSDDAGESAEDNAMISEDDNSSDNSNESDETVDIEDVNTSTIVANTDICNKLSDSFNEIQSLLNSVEDSNGVFQLRIKDDNEFWVYYKDSVNLNDVMYEAIQLLNASGYTYLEFNRLARTDNAIVFDILDSSQLNIKPRGEVLEEN